MRFTNYQPLCIYPDVPKIDFDVYEQGLRLFMTSFLEGHQGDVVFYQFGEIRTPGVSDIDLLIVVEDDTWQQSRQRAKSIISSSGLLYFLFVHEPVIVSKSILPCLPYLHTLDNCQYIQGINNPIGKLSIDIQDSSTALIRHSVWNSFIRIAALELDNSTIGLRRALILMHNLLTSVYNGNKFLLNPIDIPISTQQIREEILSAPIKSQENLAKLYIQEIVELLNKVDRRLDNQLLEENQILATLSSLPIVLGKRTILTYSANSANLQVAVTEKINFLNFWGERLFLKKLQIVQVPNYLLYLVMVLAKQYQGDLLKNI